MSENKSADIIAVSFAEMKEFGCPYCGYRSGYSMASGGGAATWNCGECEKGCVILGEGITKSPIGFGNDAEKTIYPELQPHPRRGTPSHGKPDKRPDGEGEFFWVRGIGLDQTPGCFVCGGPENLYNNIAAFVQCKAAGERVVAMFKSGARLDYRSYEPDRIQAKIGGCDQHKGSLDQLLDAVEGAKGIITTQMIEKIVGNAQS
ncbi:MAG: hypothetical protein Q7R85_00155 [bacterium]|nr:hypothetical protein [bacterium]